MEANKTEKNKSKTYLSISFLKKLDRAEPYMRELMISLVDEVQSKIIVNEGDFNDLKDAVKELTHAQKRTEIRMEELAEAQKELAEAQRNTELTVSSLSLTVKDIKKQLGGLAIAVGYEIEDRIIPHMYDFGKREFDTDVKLVERRNLVYPDGKYDEINIYAEGTKKGHPVFIIGECRAQPGRKDFDRFSRMTECVKKTVGGDICAFIAGYSFSPEVEAYAKKKYPDIRMYKTYEFELKSKER